MRRVGEIITSQGRIVYGAAWRETGAIVPSCDRTKRIQHVHRYMPQLVPPRADDTDLGREVLITNLLNAR
jgi:hypothetical protein